MVKNRDPVTIHQDMLPLGIHNKINSNYADKMHWFGDCPDDHYVLVHKKFIVYPNNKTF